MGHGGTLQAFKIRWFNPSPLVWGKGSQAAWGFPCYLAAAIGILGGLGLLIASGCDGPELLAWHWSTRGAFSGVGSTSLGMDASTAVRTALCQAGF